MRKFNLATERMKRFSSYLDKLYYSGKIKLSDLQSFRSLLKEIGDMFEKLRSLSFFGFMSASIKKDINRLNSELTLMEYNVSLITLGAL